MEYFEHISHPNRIHHISIFGEYIKKFFCVFPCFLWLQSIFCRKESLANQWYLKIFWLLFQRVSTWQIGEVSNWELEKIHIEFVEETFFIFFFWSESLFLFEFLISSLKEKKTICDFFEKIFFFTSEAKIIAKFDNRKKTFDRFSFIQVKWVFKVFTIFFQINIFEFYFLSTCFRTKLFSLKRFVSVSGLKTFQWSKKSFSNRVKFRYCKEWAEILNEIFCINIQKYSLASRTPSS